MNNIEFALNHFKELEEDIINYNDAFYVHEYLTLDDIINAIEALEKRNHKKPIPVTLNAKNAQWFHKWQSCPNCNHCFGHCFRREKISYCPECGQAIDYSEIDE